MASYSMAHLQLEILLSELSQDVQTESKLRENTNRFNIFLTNSLEEAKNERPNLFMAQWLTEEAILADKIKRDTPVMCVIGNPPYAVSSTNKSPWIQSLISDYKKNLNEQNIQPLSDDYIKFIRYGQYFIDKNGSGILAYISNNSFLDGIIHRQMRKSLLECFDKIYILDLHGNAKKKEVSPDGSPDQNVFDIMQGVSINILIKTGKKKKDSLGQVFHFDLYGKREIKYDFLKSYPFNKINWIKIENKEPNLFFLNKNYTGEKEYLSGFGLKELFLIDSVGFVTSKDEFLIDFEKSKLELKKTDILDLNLSDLDFENKYKLTTKYFNSAKERANSIRDKDSIIIKCFYRPLDLRFILYDLNFIERDRINVMKHLIGKENLGLVCSKQSTRNIVDNIQVVNSPIELKFNSHDRNSNLFPLYIYPDPNQSDVFTTPDPSKGGELQRVPNLNMDIVNEIAEKLGLIFIPEKFPSIGGVSEGRGGQKRNTKNYMNLPYNPDLTQRAKELRKAGNLSEVLFWNQVKKGQFKGYDFDRQKVIGNYIVDFYCGNCNVVIEIDGSSHDDKVEYDRNRDEFLESLGLTVIHIDVQEVFHNLDGVMEMLMNHSAFASESSEENNHPALSGTPPKEGNVFAPIDILDYIYAVLHSPTYREKYKEFLKIDFPRVPYPKDTETFWKLVKLGGEIRQIHLLESPIVEKYITKYPTDGDNTVVKPKYENGKVYINETQYFDNVPEIAWNFYIGGYQPAQKWLKDRKDRKLEFEDILHYQKIIVALTETDRLMKEVDNVGVE